MMFLPAYSRRRVAATCTGQDASTGIFTATTLKDICDIEKAARESKAYTEMCTLGYRARDQVWLVDDSTLADLWSDCHANSIAAIFYSTWVDVTCESLGIAHGPECPPDSNGHYLRKVPCGACPGAYPGHTYCSSCPNQGVFDFASCTTLADADVRGLLGYR